MSFKVEGEASLRVYVLWETENWTQFQSPLPVPQPHATMNIFMMLVCSSCGGRRIICLLCLDLLVKTPSLDASLHLPRHGRVSLDSGSHHIWEQRHGATTQPPERGMLWAHMHTHKNLCTHRAYRCSQVQACQHSHTAFSSVLTCISCSSPGLGLVLHGHSHVHPAAERSAWARGGEQSWDGVMGWEIVPLWHGQEWCWHRRKSLEASRLGLDRLLWVPGAPRPLESLPLLGCTMGVSALCAMQRQVCSYVHKRQKSISSIWHPAKQGGNPVGLLQVQSSLQWFNFNFIVTLYVHHRKVPFLLSSSDGCVLLQRIQDLLVLLLW